jgi:hypothetical protein
MRDGISAHVLSSDEDELSLSGWSESGSDFGDLDLSDLDATFAQTPVPHSARSGLTAGRSETRAQPKRALLQGSDNPADEMHTALDAEFGQMQAEHAVELSAHTPGAPTPRRTALLVKRRTRAAFSAADKNGNGEVAVRELLAVLPVNRASLSQAKALLKRFDVDGSGGLNSTEFAALQAHLSAPARAKRKKKRATAMAAATAAERTAALHDARRRRAENAEPIFFDSHDEATLVAKIAADEARKVVVEQRALAHAAAESELGVDLPFVDLPFGGAPIERKFITTSYLEEASRMHSHKADRFLPTHSRTAAARDAAEATLLARRREDIEAQLAQMTHLIDDMTDRAPVHRGRDSSVEKPVAPMERLWRNSTAPRPGGSEAGTSWKHSVDYARLARPRTERLYRDRERIEAKRAALAEKVFVEQVRACSFSFPSLSSFSHVLLLVLSLLLLLIRSYEQCQGVGLSLHQGMLVLVPNGRPHHPGLIHNEHIREHLRDSSSPDMHARLARKRGKHGAEGRGRALGAEEAARARRGKGAAAARGASLRATPPRAAMPPRRLQDTMRAMARAKAAKRRAAAPQAASRAEETEGATAPPPPAPAAHGAREDAARHSLDLVHTALAHRGVAPSDVVDRYAHALEARHVGGDAGGSNAGRQAFVVALLQHGVYIDAIEQRALFRILDPIHDGRILTARFATGSAVGAEQAGASPCARCTPRARDLGHFFCSFLLFALFFYGSRSTSNDLVRPLQRSAAHTMLPLPAPAPRPAPCPRSPPPLPALRPAPAGRPASPRRPLAALRASTGKAVHPIKKVAHALKRSIDLIELGRLLLGASSRAAGEEESNVEAAAAYALAAVASHEAPGSLGTFETLGELSSALDAAGVEMPPRAVAALFAAVDLAATGHFATGEFSFTYRYISRESCSQLDSLPLTSLTRSLGTSRQIGLKSSSSPLRRDCAGATLQRRRSKRATRSLRRRMRSGRQVPNSTRFRLKGARWRSTATSPRTNHVRLVGAGYRSTATSPRTRNFACTAPLPKRSLPSRRPR